MKKILNITIFFIMIICLSSCIYPGISKATTLFPWLKTLKAEDVIEISTVKQPVNSYNPYLKIIIHEQEKNNIILETFKKSSYVYNNSRLK